MNKENCKLQGEQISQPLSPLLPSNGDKKSKKTNKTSLKLVGKNFRIEFRVSKKRLEEIHSFEESQFNKEEKYWLVPIKNWPLIATSNFFSRSKAAYYFSQNEVEQIYSNYLSVKKEAQTKVINNPFEVDLKTAKLAEVDYLFTLAADKTSIRLNCKEEHYNRILERYKLKIHLQRDNSYIVPVECMKEVVKSVASKKSYFAIEQSAGKHLIDTSSLRHSILTGDIKPTSEELFHCLLTPNTSPHCSALQIKDNPQLFSIDHLTADHLQKIFPNTNSYQERKRLATSLTTEELAKALYIGKKNNLSIWLDSITQKSIEAYYINSKSDIKTEHIQDHWLILLQLEACLGTNQSEKLGIITKQRDLLASKKHKYLNHFIEGSLENHFLDNYYFIPFNNELLIQHFDQNSLTSLPITESFFLKLEQLRRCKELLRRHYFYSDLKDIDLSLNDQKLAKTLFPHQRVAVKWLRDTPKAFLGDDMGLGKTLSVLAHFIDIKSDNIVDFILVICPNTLVNNWEREVKSWTPGLKISPLQKEKTKRQALLNSILKEEISLDGIIINFEAVRIQEVLSALIQITKNKNILLVIDESQRAKNPRSLIFNALKTISPNCNRRILLSGTPAPKDISDIWSQIFLLDQGERFGNDFYQWLESVAELGNKWSDYAVTKFRPKEVKKVINRTRELLLRRKKETVVDLPEKIFTERFIPLNGNQLKRYNEIVRDLKLRVTSCKGKVFIRELDNILEEFLRASQVASNPRLIDPSWKGNPAKFLELDTLIKEIVEENDQSIVIWTNYLINIEELVERYSVYGSSGFSGLLKNSERSKVISDFQEKKKRILIAVPAAGGVGITLTAAQTAIYLDKTWNAEHWMQSIDRVHRIGQTGTVNIISLSQLKNR